MLISCLPIPGKFPGFWFCSDKKTMAEKDFDNENEPWDLVLEPESKWYSLRLKQLFRFRDLLFLFVRRDFVAIYKQTILGPVWFFIQPVLTAAIFSLVFSIFGNISTEGMPPLLYYICNLTMWSYFSDTLTKTSDTFTANSSIFGKVYFPRMIVPLSTVVSNLIKFGIQFLLFLGVWIYYLSTKDILHPNAAIALVPFLVILMGFMGLGMGIIISSMTTKYRDLKFLITFGIQLLMYASPIVIPLSEIINHHAKYKYLMLANPLTGIIETFKYAFLGVGIFNWWYLAYSLGFTIVIFFIGLVVFNKVEKSFMDTV
ncbi:MAG: Membrane protein of an transporter complex [Bacteroidetes bacterium]|nr:Membrane protein of an transporter complex [Bacteroidota bacterium]